MEEVNLISNMETCNKEILASIIAICTCYILPYMDASMVICKGASGILFLQGTTTILVSRYIFP